jgi:hypothetical protein
MDGDYDYDFPEIAIVIANGHSRENMGNPSVGNCDDEYDWPEIVIVIGQS